jgi:hypothetical protein
MAANSCNCTDPNCIFYDLNNEKRMQSLYDHAITHENQTGPCKLCATIAVPNPRCRKAVLWKKDSKLGWHRENRQIVVCQRVQQLLKGVSVNGFIYCPFTGFTEKQDKTMCQAFLCANPGRFACAACKNAVYCSPSCQKANWNDHKMVCGS